MPKTSDVSTTATTKSKSEGDSAPAELTGARERAAQAAESAQYTKNVGELTAFALVSSVQAFRI